MPDLTTHAVRVRTVPARDQTPDAISDAAKRASDIGVGVIALSTRAVADVLDRYWPGSTPPGRSNPSVARRFAHAATGVALVTERRLLAAGTAAERATQLAVDTARRVPIVRDVLLGVDASLDRWSDRADIETNQSQQAFTDFVSRLVPGLIDTFLERVDFAALAGRIPLADIAGAVDLDAVLEHVDIDALLRQIDVNALLDRVDVEALLARVDVDGLMNRVDLDALLDRVELGPLVTDVLDEVDIGGIVRESTGSITGDAVDSARLTAMRLDGFVARVADRVLLRGATARNPVPDPTVDSDAAPDRVPT